MSNKEENPRKPSAEVRGLLGKILGQIPDGFSGVARIRLPEETGGDAVLEYDGKIIYFSPSFWGSSDSSQVTPTLVVPSDDKPCL